MDAVFAITERIERYLNAHGEIIPVVRNIEARGYMTMTDYFSLTHVGLPIMGALEDILEMDNCEFFNKLSKGHISSADFFCAFGCVAERLYGKQIENKIV